MTTAEEDRLTAAREGKAKWRLWGPYLSERQWGTVREDYSPDGTAWEYLPHDHARSRAYRWGMRQRAAIVLRARAVERRRPDSQGTPVRTHRQRGQPRRGRQGVLLLPRQRAEPRVHDVPVQVSAARVSVCGSRGRVRAAHAQRSRVRAPGHRYLRG